MQTENYQAHRPCPQPLPPLYGRFVRVQRVNVDATEVLEGKCEADDADRILAEKLLQRVRQRRVVGAGELHGVLLRLGPPSPTPCGYLGPAPRSGAGNRNIFESLTAPTNKSF